LAAVLSDEPWLFTNISELPQIVEKRPLGSTKSTSAATARPTSTLGKVGVEVIAPVVPLK
jgi:hypothetical protein